MWQGLVNVGAPDGVASPGKHDLGKMAPVAQSGGGASLRPRRARLTPLLLRGVAGLLGVTSVAKLLSLAGNPAILSAPDPIIGVPYRWALLGESVVELAVAVLLLSRISQAARLLLVFWLGASFCGYHLALAVLDPSALCPCLGTLYGKLGVTPAQADIAARVLAVCLLVGPIVVWGRDKVKAQTGESGRVHATAGRGAAFTLVALLVAIAIMAVLAASLLPMLARVNAKAKVAVSVSNQKQLWLPRWMYAEDHGGGSAANGGPLVAGELWVQGGLLSSADCTDLDLIMNSQHAEFAGFLRSACSRALCHHRGIYDGRWGVLAFGSEHVEGRWWPDPWTLAAASPDLREREDASPNKAGVVRLEQGGIRPGRQDRSGT